MWKADTRAERERLDVGLAAMLALIREDEHHGIVPLARNYCGHVRWHLNRGVVKPGCSHCGVTRAPR